jgi:hypothetical protein
MFFVMFCGGFSTFESMFSFIFYVFILIFLLWGFIVEYKKNDMTPSMRVKLEKSRL